ncbi:MAG: DMT family transporter [Deltaproteobacteria bacterium]|nr:DMT family transporter [Deltaproteobacteria bacterium]
MLNSWLYASIAVLLWSTVATAFSISLRFLNVIQLLFLSSLFSFISLGCIICFRAVFLKKTVSVTKKAVLRSMFSGLLNPVGYYLVLFSSYSLLSAQHAQAINYSWGVTLGIISAVFLGQKFTLWDLTGSLIAWMGVVFIVLESASNSPEGINYYGVLLAIGSTVIWSGYWILQSISSNDELTDMFFNFFWGTLYSLLLLIGTDNLFFPSVIALSGAAWVGFFEMGITFLLWLKAMKTSQKVSDITTLIFLSPFLSLVFIAFVASEKVRWQSIGGLIIIVSGLLLKQFFNNRE